MRFIAILVTLLIFNGPSFAQYSITGKVTNKNGESLESASVFLVKESFATSTDYKGLYSLKDIPEGIYTLKVSYVGYLDYVEEIKLSENLEKDIMLSGMIYGIDQIEIKANKLTDLDAPFTYLNIEKDEISKTNLGQDVPHLLQYTPSAIATSDAGAGIGYTGLRIRGSDATRVNVTINGIPLNDSESQGVFWVNLPDLSSSVENIQIQRGVGTSTSGSGAFGATIGMNTHQMHHNPYAEINAGYGSFDTKKINAKIGTGLMNGAYSVDFRYSVIKSDGYIDRASSDLDSWNLSFAKIHDKGSIRLDILSGREVTYQSWNGSPESKIEGDLNALQVHYQNNKFSLYPTQQDSINLFDSDRRYNYYLYDNQVDDYSQNHYQFHLAQLLNDNLKFNASLHFTKGRGFFEEFKYKDALADYGLQNIIIDQDTISEANLVRKRWLDNDFFGGLFNFSYDPSEKLNLLFGGGINRYNGDHFGRISFHEYDEQVDRTRNYYENIGNKDDLNLFVKANIHLGQNLDVFGDLQFRKVDYTAKGIDNDGVAIDINDNLNFFNPKIGLKYDLNDQSNIYASFGIGNREPVRSDYISASVQGRDLKHETLRNLEIGYRKTSYKANFEAVLYIMDYKNQLVLTGELNDVGANLRSNVDKSRRMGLELSAYWNITEKLIWSPNFTISQNKISDFVEYIYNDDIKDYEEINYQDTDISFSPSLVGGSRLAYNLNNHIQFEWLSKYVGKQFLDNTSNDQRALDAYFVNDFRVSYTTELKALKKLSVNLLINNIADHLYSSNGYTYSYKYGDLITENFLYPQAGRHFLLGLTLSF